MKRSLPIFALLSLAALLSAADKPFAYPQPPKSDQSDDYHGTKVADPYRDLENLDSDATKKWIEAENKLTFDYLAGIPERKKIGEKMTALWNYEKFTVPYHDGGRYGPAPGPDARPPEVEQDSRHQQYTELAR